MWSRLIRYNSRLIWAVDRLFGHADQPHLPVADRELILFGLYATYGSTGDAETHGRLSLAAGARPEALEEVVLTAAISRGPRALVTVEAFLADLPRDEMHLERPDRASDPSIYFEEEFGTVPQWARRLAQCSSQTFESYAVLRAALLADGATSRVTKELLTMCLNVLDNTPGGIRSHAAAALRCGAGYEAVLGALLLTLPIGGIVAWINGVQALSDLLDAANGGLAEARVDPAV